MISTRDAYNVWATSYNEDENKTRDLEHAVIQKILSAPFYGNILEIGCGTGKNTWWLATKADLLTAVDFSPKMIEVAKKKNASEHVKFLEADVTRPWNFGKYNLIGCSLILEHIKDIEFIFQQASHSLEEDGLFYIGELHPYKQLSGSRARFEHEGRTVHLEYFIHHISQFMQCAKENQMKCISLDEWFDPPSSIDSTPLPRLVSFLFKKSFS